MTKDQSTAEELRLRHAAVSELQASLLTTKTVEAFLQQVVDRAAGHVAADIACTLTLLRQGRYLTVASTDEAATEADQVEYETGSGPCVEAATSGVESVIVDLRTDDRWPEWAAASLRLGFLSAAGVPADTGAGAQLALDLYGRQPDMFGEPEMQRARIYVDEAARALRLCLLLSEMTERTEHLQSAMASRSTIDQALGVIMGQNRISRDDAFAILRSASQHRNTKLRDVAATLIENLTGHPAEENLPFGRAPQP
jgi:transcriptional regulator with GAF, ATPase, and Fis domain